MLIIIQELQEYIVLFQGTFIKYGRGEEIWTPDFLVPNQARYQAALLPDSLLA